MKKKLVALLLIMTLLFSLAACNKSNGSDSGKEVNTTPKSESDTDTKAGEGDSSGALITKDITINIRAMNQYTNLERILEKYYELVKDDPNLSHVKLNFSYVTGADYKDKLTTAVVGQEDLDLLFVGSWQGRTDFMKDGVFKDLSKYFEDADNYPGLNEVFPKNMLDAQKFNGGLYYVPLGAGEDLRGVIYREDLRKQYGCAEIVDEATLMAYLQTIQSHIDDGSLEMNFAWGVGSQGYMTFRNMMFEAPKNNIFKVNAGTDFFVYVDDNNKVVNAVTMGDDETQFAGFPEGYNKDFIAEHMADLTNWVKYSSNYAVDGDQYIEFTLGQSAVAYKSFHEQGNAITDLKKNFPDAETGFFVFDEDQRNMVPNGIPSTLSANNSVAVPAWSSDEKTTAVMCFLDALYGRKDINNLFTYGVEGVDWESTDGIVQKPLKVSEDPDFYSFPGYSLIYTPAGFGYYLDWVAADEKLKKYYDYQSDLENSYTVTKDSGFAFDATNVEIEKAAVSGVAENYMFNYGTYETIDATYAKIAEQHKQFESAGIETIRQEIIKQMQAFFDAK